FADGEYAATGRVSFLPYYANEGRCLVHVAASTTWRANRRSPIEGGPPQTSFTQRPLLRDFAGDLIGSAANNPGNRNALVATPTFNSNDTIVYGLEFLSILGPFSVQAEYGWAVCNLDAANAAAAGGKGHIQTPAGYVQLSYFLTGENRIYD